MREDLYVVDLSLDDLSECILVFLVNIDNVNKAKLVRCKELTFFVVPCYACVYNLVWICKSCQLFAVGHLEPF